MNMLRLDGEIFESEKKKLRIQKISGYVRDEALIYRETDCKQYNNVSKKCNLCLQEKLLISQYIGEREPRRLISCLKF